MGGHPSAEAQKFAAAANYVPGVGTALAAVVGFVSSLTGDPQAENPFYGPTGFAGGLYDPPNVWRPGKPGCAFQGMLWGYKPMAYDVDEARRRVDDSELVLGGRVKGIYERQVMDIKIISARVDALKKHWAKPPGPTFYYAPVPTWSSWTAARYERGRELALANGKVVVRFGSPQWQGTLWADLGTWLSWHSKNKPGYLKEKFGEVLRPAKQQHALELADWKRFREAIELERQKQAFLSQAKAEAEAAALAAYEYALAQAQGNYAQPPLPATVIPNPIPEAAPAASPNQLLDMGAVFKEPGAKKAAAVGGLGILALLLL